MKSRLQLIHIAACVGLCAVTFTSSARADESDQKTYMTFRRPVEVPGVALPPGTYVFEVPATANDRHIVRVLSPAGDRVYATFFTQPVSRSKATSETAVTFMETGPRSPMPIRTWFYPGDTGGHLFVYPKDQARQIASGSRERERQRLAQARRRVGRTRTRASATTRKNP